MLDAVTELRTQRGHHQSGTILRVRGRPDDDDDQLDAAVSRRRLLRFCHLLRVMSSRCRFWPPQRVC
jgi:hypothetical protein